MRWPRSHFLSTLLCAVAVLAVASVPHPRPTVVERAGQRLPFEGRKQEQRRTHTSPAVVESTVSPPADINCAVVACLALTFDDGPDTLNTPRVLDALRNKNVKATFFVVGANAATHPDIIRRIYREGHEIGNHSWNHPSFTTLNPAQIRDQINSTQMAVINAGAPAPQWFRPPYGAMDAEVRAHVPLNLALWNVDPEDWGKKDPNGIADHIKAHAGAGRVIDLHDMHGPTADALPPLIDALRMHYHFVTMSELFDTIPGQRGEYYGR